MLENKDKPLCGGENMKKMLSIVLLVSIIALMLSQLASVYAKLSTPEPPCSAYGVTPCLIPGVTREDANHLAHRLASNNIIESAPSNVIELAEVIIGESATESFSASVGLTPELRGGNTREGPRPTPELVVPEPTTT